MAVIFPLDYAQAGTIIDDVRFLSSCFLDRNAHLPKKELHDNLVPSIPSPLSATSKWDCYVDQTSTTRVPPDRTPRVFSHSRYRLTLTRWTGRF